MHHFRTVCYAVMLSVVLSLCCAGCKGKSESADTSAPAGKATKGPETGNASAEEKLRVALVMKTMSLG